MEDCGANGLQVHRKREAVACEDDGALPGALLHARLFVALARVHPPVVPGTTGRAVALLHEEGGGGQCTRLVVSDEQVTRS